jgi:hypothetical protein
VKLPHPEVPEEVVKHCQASFLRESWRGRSGSVALEEKSTVIAAGLFFTWEHEKEHAILGGMEEMLGILPLAHLCLSCCQETVRYNVHLTFGGCTGYNRLSHEEESDLLNRYSQDVPFLLQRAMQGWKRYDHLINVWPDREVTCFMLGRWWKKTVQVTDKHLWSLLMSHVNACV